MRITSGDSELADDRELGDHQSPKQWCASINYSWIVGKRSHFGLTAALVVSLVDCNDFAMGMKCIAADCTVMDSNGTTKWVLIRDD